MAWDDGDKGNPWRSDKDKGPADLDAVVRDLQRKLAGLFRGGGGAGRGGSGDQGLSGGLTASALVIIALVWASFGFYRVDAAERGVEFRFGAFQGLTSPGLAVAFAMAHRERGERSTPAPRSALNYRASMLTMRREHRERRAGGSVPAHRSAELPVQSCAIRKRRSKRRPRARSAR